MAVLTGNSVAGSDVCVGRWEVERAKAYTRARSR